LFSAVISEHFSKNRVIISVVAAKMWYLKKNVRFLLGHPVCVRAFVFASGMLNTYARTEKSAPSCSGGKCQKSNVGKYAQYEEEKTRIK